MAVDYKVECAFGYGANSYHSRNNLAPNSSFASGLVTYGYNAPTHYTSSVLPTGGVDGREFLRAVRAVGGAASAPFLGSPYQASSPGDAYTVSVYLRPVGTVRNVRMIIYSIDASNNLTAVANKSIALKANQWVRLVASGVMVTAAANMAWYLYPANNDFTEAVDGVDVDHILVESGIVTPCDWFPQTGLAINVPGPADNLWTDISGYVNGLDVDRGRNNEFDEIETGVLNLKLDNEDGRFTPERPPLNILRSNRSYNNDFEDGVIVGTNTNNGIYWTAACSGLTPISGLFSFLTSRTATALDTGVSSIYHFPDATAIVGTKVTPGQGYRISCDVKVENANREIRTFLQFRDAAGTVLGNYGQNSVFNPAPGAVTRVGAESIAPATADSIVVIVQVFATVGLALSGERVWYDNFLTEDALGVRDYFNEQTPGAAWAGIPRQSRLNLWDSPYYPNVVPGVPVRVTASDDGWLSYHSVFTGTIEKWPVTLSGIAECSPTATDMLGTLASDVFEPLRETLSDISGLLDYRPLNEVTGWADISQATPNVYTVPVSPNGANVETFGTMEGNTFYGNGGQGVQLTCSSGAFGKGVKVPASTYPYATTFNFLWRPDARVSIANSEAQTLISVQFAGTDSGGARLPALAIRTVANTGGPGVKIRAFLEYSDTGTVTALGGGAVGPIGWIQADTPVAIGMRIDCNDPFNVLCRVEVMTPDGNIYGTTVTVPATLGSFDYVTLGGNPDLNLSWASGWFSEFVTRSGSNLVTDVFPQVMPGAYDNVANAIRKISKWVLAGVDYLEMPNGEATVYRTPLNWAGTRSALDAIKETANGGDAIVFGGRDGRLCYRGKWRRARETAAALSLTGTYAVEDDGLNLYVDEQTITNDVTVSGAAGASVRAVDSSSVTKYGLKVVTIDTALTDSTEVEGAAKYRLWFSANPRVRLEGVSVALTAFPDPAALLRLDIGSRVTVGLPGAAPWPSRDFIVEGVSHNVTVAGSVPEAGLALRLSPITAGEGWVLEDSANGALDSTTRLMY